jgi:hypothetical protein
MIATPAGAVRAPPRLFGLLRVGGRLAASRTGSFAGVYTAINGKDDARERIRLNIYLTKMVYSAYGLKNIRLFLNNVAPFGSAKG